MKKARTILVIAQEAWVHNWANWLNSRSYETDYAISWEEAIRKLRYSKYDLILLDAEFWSEAAVALIKRGELVAVLAGDYSRDGHRQFAAAGARGYLDRNLDADRFIIEIEKVFRILRMAPLRGRVLIVDNDQQVRAALKNNLTLEGYEVILAAEADDAYRKVQECRPHVAVIDIRLRDDEDRLDDSGFDLIERLYTSFGHALKLVGLTGSPSRNAASRSVPYLSDFVEKRSSAESEGFQIDRLLQAIQAAYEKLDINSALEIEYEVPLTVRGLVRMMGSYQSFSEEQQNRVAEEVEELIRKLFPRELRITILHLSPRRGGAGVVLVQPEVEGSKGNFVVIKFGPRALIEREAANYRRCVQYFVESPATRLLDAGQYPTETLNLGALKFGLSDITSEVPRSFHQFFSDTRTTIADVVGVLEHLFRVTCRSWYNNREDWSAASVKDLIGSYEAFVFRQKNKEEIILSSLEAIVGERSFGGISFDRSRGDLHILFGHTDIVLPDPQTFLGRLGSVIPRPRSRCRVHGNLHGQNLLLDSNKKAWLIDFSMTGWGSALTDFTSLESSIKFEMIEQSDFTILYEMEKSLLLPSRDEVIEADPRLADPVMMKAIRTIGRLRQLARELTYSSDMREYYLGLLFHALRFIACEGTSSGERNRRPVRQRHALMSAAMLCQRLTYWEPWRGWPDERKNLTVG